MGDKSDCRRYYQLVQEKVLPESMDSTINPITSISNKTQNEDVEDLNLGFKDMSENQIHSVLPRQVKLKYFERDTEDEDENDDFDNNSHTIQNGDGHYIMEDDAWSDYWDSGVDDIDHVFSKSRLEPIDDEKENVFQNSHLQSIKLNERTDKLPKNYPVKVMNIRNNFLFNFQKNNYLYIYWSVYNVE